MKPLLTAIPLILSVSAGLAPIETTPANQIEVTARADLLNRDRVGAQMDIFVNSKLVARDFIRHRDWRTKEYSVPNLLRAGDRVDIFYANDISNNSGDRNLWVQQIRHGAHSMVSASASYDLGTTYADSADGIDTRPAREVLPWGGSLRFVWKSPTSDTVAPGGGPQAPMGPASGPIVAKSRQRISGLRITSESGPCVQIPAGVTDVIIENNDIGPCGGSEPKVGIDALPDSQSINVSNNRIHGVATGMLATRAKHPIRFENNTVYDVRGPMPRGQMVQFDGVRQGSGQSVIRRNTSDKGMATAPTRYEDHINLFNSAGTSTFPLLVTCNRLRGGDSDSGSGIIVGDHGGEWIDVNRNTVVLTPNAGIGVAGGKNISVRGNSVYNSGRDALSRTQSAFYVMSFSNHVPTNVTLTHNRGVARAWMQGSGHIWGGYWSDQTAVNLTESSNVWQDEGLSEEIWNSAFADC